MKHEVVQRLSGELAIEPGKERGMTMTIWTIANGCIAAIQVAAILVFWGLLADIKRTADRVINAVERSE